MQFVQISVEAGYFERIQLRTLPQQVDSFSHCTFNHRYFLPPKKYGMIFLYFQFHHFAPAFTKRHSCYGEFLCLFPKCTSLSLVFHAENLTELIHNWRIFWKVFSHFKWISVLINQDIESKCESELFFITISIKFGFESAWLFIRVSFRGFQIRLKFVKRSADKHVWIICLSILWGSKW